MKMKKYTVFTLVLTMMTLLSCGSGNDENRPEENTSIEGQTDETSCLFRYNEGTTKLTWTGYKTTAKLSLIHI